MEHEGISRGYEETCDGYNPSERYLNPSEVLQGILEMLPGDEKSFPVVVNQEVYDALFAAIKNLGLTSYGFEILFDAYRITVKFPYKPTLV